MSHLHPVNDHGGLVSLPRRQPVVLLGPEVCGGVRRVVGPRLGGAAVVVAVREETVSTAHSNVEDQVELGKE